MQPRSFVIPLITMLVACSSSEQRDLSKTSPVTVSVQGKESPTPSVPTFAELYRNSKSESERRAITLRAIDEGVVHAGGSIASVDEVFGTRFQYELPSKQERKRSGVIHFVVDDTKSRGENSSVARAYGGWHFVVEINDGGKLLSYYLTNLNKGMSTIVETRQNYSLSDLESLYKSASTATAQRQVCLQAIDSGVVTTTGSITTIDRIFGTHFAAQLPARNRVSRMVQIRFADRVSNDANKTASMTVADQKWFLAVEYDYNGDIQNYYLSNR